MIKNIVSIIEKKINLLKLKKSELYKKIMKSNNEAGNIINKINLVIEDPRNISRLTAEDYKELEKFYDESVLQNLKAYEIILANDGFELYDEYFKKTKNVFYDIKEKYEKHNEGILSTNEEFRELVKKSDQLKHLLSKIKHDFSLEPDDIDLIIEVCQNDGKTQEEIMDIIIYIANNCIKEFNLPKVVLDLKDSLTENPEEEIEELEETNLTDEELINLFNNYGYDFTTFDKKSIDILKKYGNIANIDYMLSVLQKENINITSSILKQSKYLAEIFVYSTPNLFEATLLLAKTKGLNLATDFKQLIKIPGIFINKKRDLLRLYKMPGSGGDADGISGSHEDFEKNIDLIESVFTQYYPNQSFSELFKKCCFIFSKPHKMIDNAIKTYDDYKISPINYIKTLSSLNSYNQADVLDLALELDCFSYVKNNLSRAILLPDNKIFFIIARAKQLGYTDDQIFKDGKLRYRILNSEPGIKIDDYNGSKVTNKFIVDDVRKQIFQEYDSVLSDAVRQDGVDYSVVQQILNNPSSKNKINVLDGQFVNPKNPLVYNINGVTISRKKFLRIYNALVKRNIDESEDLLIYSLTKNSIITQEQFDMIEAEVHKIYKNKELRKW